MSVKPRRWILLRGLGRHAGHWGEFLARFKKAFPNDDVETLDLAGNGTEADRTSFRTIEENVADLRARSKLLKKGPVSILAVSMGAMVAVAWADQHPGETRELVLINTSDSRESYFFERLRPRNYLPILKLFKQRGDLMFRERTLLQMTAGELPHLERIAEKQSELPATTPENFLRQLWASSRYSFPKSQPIRRIQFLVADGDSLVHPNCTKRLAVKWNAPLAAHPRADHDLTLIDPDWVIGRVRHFTGKSEIQNETNS
ncbi:MAG: alpha/beta hydrolase [Bdellovibrionaceae bacterium]|nr:alpha/beta hydrolase [Pseudobdellovibrionaceae bacterium]